MSTPHSSTVFVVDDDAELRAVLSDVLSDAGLACEVYPGPMEFLRACDPQRPGCLLLDVRMPLMSGLVLLEELRTAGIELPVVVLTGHADVPMVVRAFKLGAVEFLEKPFDNEVLVGALRKALALDAENRRREAPRRALEQRLARLSAREKTVLDGLLAGRAHKCIAGELGLSLSTVETHRKRILAKLDANNSAELLRMVLGTSSE